MNLADALDALVDADPARVALLGDGRAWTRAALRHAIDAMAARLATDHAVTAGTRVGYLGANCPAEVVLLFALARLGAVFVPLNTRLATAERVSILRHAGLHALVTDDAHRDAGRAAIEAIDGPLPRAGSRPTTLAIESLAADAADAVVGRDGGHRRGGAFRGGAAAGGADPVLLVYTSGTTAAPKGAVHTHAGLLANAAASIAAHAMTPDDRVLTVLPLFHVGGLCIQTVPALLAGATVLLHPRFDARAWLDAVAAWRPTLTLMVPATLRAAIAEPAWHTTDLSCLRVLMTGSSVIPRGLIDAIHARGVPVGQIYGSTETGPVTVALTAADARRKAGFAGWPCFPDSVRLCDAAGRDVAAGAVGEVVVRAPNVMLGYRAEPPGTGFRDGWFATGDLGRLDDDGCLEVVGRARDLIITGGENVYPAEIEDVLLSIAGVAEAAVVGVPDERWGEVPAAFVVRVRDAPLDEAAVRAAFVDRIARFKHPKRVVFVDALPRNAMGKVEAHRLRERLVASPQDAAAGSGR